MICQQPFTITIKIIDLISAVSEQVGFELFDALPSSTKRHIMQVKGSPWTKNKSYPNSVIDMFLPRLMSE